MAIEYTLYLNTGDSPLHLHGIVCACIGDESDAASASLLAFSEDGLQGVVLVPDDVTRRFHLSAVETLIRGLSGSWDPAGGRQPSPCLPRAAIVYAQWNAAHIPIHPRTRPKGR